MDTLLHRAKTPTLNIAYEQTGPNTGDPILLLHGFPYDVREYDALRDRLARARRPRRIIVPYLRGYGPTLYASDTAFRSGQQAALGKDVIDLMDALRIERATLVGYDWGGRAACVAAALWPERVRALLSVDSYAIQDIAKSTTTPQSVEQEKQFWYQWYFQTERGRRGLAGNRNSLCKDLWKTWSPNWHFDDKLFATTAQSFQNPDFVDTVIHSYRHRYSDAPGDPALEPLEARLAKQPKIICPTTVLKGASDPVDPPSTTEKQEKHFTNRYTRRILPKIGHCVPAEAPEAVERAVNDLLKSLT